LRRLNRRKLNILSGALIGHRAAARCHDNRRPDKRRPLTLDAKHAQHLRRSRTQAHSMQHSTVVFNGAGSQTIRGELL